MLNVVCVGVVGFTPVRQTASGGQSEIYDFW